MGCGCKKKTVIDEKTGELVEVEEKINYVVNSIVFLIGVLLSPIVIPVTIYILFKHLFVGESLDIITIVKAFMDKKKDKYEDEYEDLDTLNPEEYELELVN